MRGRACLLLFLMSALAAPLVAGEGKILGSVVDDEGKPMRGVSVTLRSTEGEVEQSEQTTRKGRFTLAVPDTGLSWVIRFESEGLPPLEEPLGELPEGVVEIGWVLSDKGVAAEGPRYSDEVVAVYNEGAQAFRDGDLARALERFETAVAMAPDLEPAWQLLAPLYLDAGRNQEAFDAAGRTLVFVPDDVTALRARYDAARALGLRDEQESALDRLLLVEQSPEVAARLFNSGNAALRAEDSERAERRFRQALEMNPGQQAACTGLGNVLLTRQDFEKALELSDECLKVSPKASGPLTVRFNALRALGRSEEADQAFAVLRASDPVVAADITFRLGEALFKLNDAEQALIAFRRTLEASPDHAAAHYKVALSLINLGQTEEAAVHLRRFLELSPEDLEADAAREMLGHLD